MGDQVSRPCTPFYQAALGPEVLKLEEAEGAEGGARVPSSMTGQAWPKALNNSWFAGAITRCKRGCCKTGGRQREAGRISKPVGDDFPLCGVDRTTSGPKLDGLWGKESDSQSAAGSRPTCLMLGK